MSFIPSEYVDVHEIKEKEKTTHIIPKKSFNPSARGEQSSMDGVLLKRKTKGKNRKIHSALLGDPLIRFSSDPPIQPRGPGFFQVFLAHEPSYLR